MDFTSYITPELLILIPVIYLLGIGLKKSEMKNKWIPLVLGGISILLSAFWVLGTTNIPGWRELLIALFSAITQGILVAGTAVYANQLIVQSKKEE